MHPWRARVFVAGLALAALAVWLALGTALGPGNAQAALTGGWLATFTTVFLGLFLEAGPFLLAGSLASGLAEVFISPDWLARWVPRTPLRGALLGAGLGLFFPVCECGVVPLARRLLHKGLPLPAGVAFLLAAPVFNPVVIASTAAAFGFGPLLAGRLGLTLLVAVATGLVVGRRAQPGQWLAPAARPTISGGATATPAPPQVVPWRAGLARAAIHAADDFFDMGRYLVVGAILAALLQTLVPQSAMLAVGRGPVLSVGVLMALAVVLSVCSTVDAFIALAFAASFTPGAVLAFLVFGPMVDIKSTLMYLGLFRRRRVAALVAVPAALTFVAAVAVNLVGR